MTSSAQFNAIVLAGDRQTPDPVAQAAGVCCKALSLVDDQPMVQRVLHALQQSRFIEHCLLCADQQSLQQNSASLATQELQWLAPEATPSASVLKALTHLSLNQAVLLTTADHALLRTEIVDYFCQEAIQQQADLVVGLADYHQIKQTLPQVKRTVYRFRDGHYCGCNLFAILSPKARLLVQQWQSIEQHRKRPWQILNLLGWQTVGRYLLGQLSLSWIQTQLSRRLGVKVHAVILPFPEAAIDVDTPEDWHLVNQLAKATNQ